MSLPAKGMFRRRHYRSLRQLGADMRRVMRLRGPGRVSPQLRERLILIVTSVNRCPYCATYHAGLAKLSGLSAEEIALLLDGSTAQVPEAEVPALQYARHWAEQAGQALPEFDAQLVDRYGSDQATAINRVLSMIWVGNLLGNSWDALRFKLSGGRFANQ